jgi:ribosomal protein L34E
MAPAYTALALLTPQNAALEHVRQHVEPYLRCSSCKQFFPSKMLRLRFFQRRSPQPTCPICGAQSSFAALSPAEMAALLKSQNRGSLGALLGMAVAAIAVAAFVWFTSR